MAIATSVEPPTKEPDFMNESIELTIPDLPAVSRKYSKDTIDELPALKNRQQQNDSMSSKNNGLTLTFNKSIAASSRSATYSQTISAISMVNIIRFHRGRRLALGCCYISLILDIALGLTAFINCVRTKSFIGISYSVDTLMDSICTGFVAWHLSSESISKIHHRDKLACCVIGALFIGSCFAIESRAVQSMISAKAARPDFVVFVYSLIHILVFTLLSVIKIFISKQIKSSALMADALNSIIGLIMSFPLLFWDSVKFLHKFSHLDDLVQVLMAVFLFLTGWNLILNSITTMNAEYARNLRENKLRQMLKQYHEEMNVNFKTRVTNLSSLSIVPLGDSVHFSLIKSQA